MKLADKLKQLNRKSGKTDVEYFKSKLIVRFVNSQCESQYFKFDWDESYDIESVKSIEKFCKEEGFKMTLLTEHLDPIMFDPTCSTYRITFDDMSFKEACNTIRG